MKPVLICIGTILLLQPALILSYSDDDADDVSDDPNQYRARRGWSMMRLGRGLQMLRLGKRAASVEASASSNDGIVPSTPEQMRAMLSALVEEHRNVQRRQPPLPRYGRELELTLNPMTSSDDVYALLDRASYNRGLGFKPFSYGHWAGRYKRSTTDNGVGSASTNQDVYAAASAYPQLEFGYYYPVPDTVSSSQARAVALPRIGRYLNRLQKIRPAKAVPAPRIGRDDEVKITETDAAAAGAA